MLARLFNTGYPVQRVRGDLDNFFDGFFPRVLPTDGVTNSRAVPAVNLWEDDDNVYAEVELPGLKMEDIEVHVLGNELSIKGQRQEIEEQGDGVSFYRRERVGGSFSRAFRLPVDIDGARVEAHLADGVLTVKLPKVAEAKPHKIEVNVQKT